MTLALCEFARYGWWPRPLTVGSRGGGGGRSRVVMACSDRT